MGFPNLNPLPHPNAARVYADWLYSKDGQQAMVDLETIGLAEPTKKMRDFFSSVYATP